MAQWWSLVSIAARVALAVTLLEDTARQIWMALMVHLHPPLTSSSTQLFRRSPVAGCPLSSPSSSSFSSSRSLSFFSPASSHSSTASASPCRVHFLCFSFFSYLLLRVGRASLLLVKSSSLSVDALHPFDQFFACLVACYVSLCWFFSRRRKQMRNERRTLSLILFTFLQRQ